MAVLVQSVKFSKSSFFMILYLLELEIKNGMICGKRKNCGRKIEWGLQRETVTIVAEAPPFHQAELKAAFIR